jgi:5-methylcytosine-specific restriction enzyme A
MSFPSPTKLLDIRVTNLYIFSHTAGECPQREAWPSGRAFFVGVLMANRPLKPCNHPGCSALSSTSYCAQHTPQDARRYDRQRGTSAQRGYDYRWQNRSKFFLACNPLCVYCQREGRITAATLVDHATPHRGDQNLFWDETNWQALCETCHNSRKQSEEKKPLRFPR